MLSDLIKLYQALKEAPMGKKSECINCLRHLKLLSHVISPHGGNQGNVICPHDKDPWEIDRWGKNESHIVGRWGKHIRRKIWFVESYHNGENLTASIPSKYLALILEWTAFFWFSLAAGISFTATDKLRSKPISFYWYFFNVILSRCKLTDYNCSHLLYLLSIHLISLFHSTCQSGTQYRVLSI